MASKLLERFVSVTVFPALVVPIAVDGKARDAAEKVTGAMPVPVRLTTCVPGVALSTIVTAPSIAPSASGVKVTLNWQEAPTAMAEGHVVAAKPPLVVMLVILSVAFPVFFSVTVLDALVVPRACEEKVSDGGVRVTTWAAARTETKAKSNTAHDGMVLNLFLVLDAVMVRPGVQDMATLLGSKMGSDYGAAVTDTDGIALTCGRG